MRKFLIALAIMGSVIASDVIAAPLSCVPYVRQNSTVDLRGDAWMWWNAAAGVYDRGSKPMAGSVLVFKRTGHMVKGHVALVSKVLSRREVLIDHANWAPQSSRERGRVAENVRVIDVSAANDWSEVRVWYGPLGDYGTHAYPSYGFIYAPHGVGPKRHGLVTDASYSPAIGSDVDMETVAPNVPAVSGASMVPAERVSNDLSGPTGRKGAAVQTVAAAAQALPVTNKICKADSATALDSLIHAGREAAKVALVDPTQVVWHEPTLEN